jgi:hypothetical protein
MGNIAPAEPDERYHAKPDEPAMAAWLKRNGLRPNRGGST